MSTRLLSLLVIVLVASAVALAVYLQPTSPTESDEPHGPPGGDFTLQSADGPFDTATLRGKVALIYFGYTYCPDICPTSLSAIVQAFNRLTPDELARVQVVFVSVDPQRDTPARLKDYVAFFHPNMIGVTGSDAEIDAAASQYGAFYARHDADSTASYVVDHSAWIYVVAPDGRLAGRITHGATVDETVAEIRKWLPPPPPPKGTS
jgi:protein SCO1/2